MLMRRVELMIKHQHCTLRRSKTPGKKIFDQDFDVVHLIDIPQHA